MTEYLLLADLRYLPCQISSVQLAFIAINCKHHVIQLTNGQYVVCHSLTISARNTTDKWSVNYVPRTNQHMAKQYSGQFIVCGAMLEYSLYLLKFIYVYSILASSQPPTASQAAARTTRTRRKPFRYCHLMCKDSIMESHRFTCSVCPLSYQHERGLRSHYLIAHQMGYLSHSVGRSLFLRRQTGKSSAGSRSRSFEPRRRRVRATAAPTTTRRTPSPLRRLRTMASPSAAGDEPSSSGEASDVDSSQDVDSLFPSLFMPHYDPVGGTITSSATPSTTAQGRRPISLA